VGKRRNFADNLTTRNKIFKFSGRREGGDVMGIRPDRTIDGGTEAMGTEKLVESGVC